MFQTTTWTTYSNALFPEAYICIGKSRKKIKNGNVYLNDGDEYQIELFNPCLTNVLAKIELDGKSLGSGIILKPGMRIFLERFLDTNKKFKFSTYEVDANSKAVDNAISNNGNIAIYFHAEKVKNQIPITNWTYLNYKDSNIGLGDNQHFNFFSSTGTANPNASNNTITYTSTDFGSAGNSMKLSKSVLRETNLKETGTTDKGNISDQKFVEVDMDFELCRFHYVTYKALPKSQEIVTPKEIKVYCTSCGRKSKDKENFCPKCGNKL